MQLKLKQSIRCKGVQHRPPKVVDTKELGISDMEAKVLIGRGVADLYEGAAAVVQLSSAPEITNLGLGAVDGTLDGVVTADGKQQDLDSLTKDELIAVAKGMDVSFNSRTTKEQLIALIKAEPVSGADGEDGDSGDDDQTDAGESEGDDTDAGAGANGEDGDQGE